MAYTDLVADAGTDFSYSLDLEGDDGTPVNVASYIFSSQIRKSYYTSSVTANVTMTVTDAANGVVQMSMTAANTANITPGRYVYDVKMIDSAGQTSRIVEGIITITPRVTV